MQMDTIYMEDPFPPEEPPRDNFAYTNTAYDTQHDVPRMYPNSSEEYYTAERFQEEHGSFRSERRGWVEMRVACVMRKGLGRLTRRLPSSVFISKLIRVFVCLEICISCSFEKGWMHLAEIMKKTSKIQRKEVG